MSVPHSMKKSQWHVWQRNRFFEVRERQATTEEAAIAANDGAAAPTEV